MEQLRGHCRRESHLMTFWRVVARRFAREALAPVIATTLAAVIVPVKWRDLLCSLAYRRVRLEPELAKPNRDAAIHGWVGLRGM